MSVTRPSNRKERRIVSEYLKRNQAMELTRNVEVPYVERGYDNNLTAWQHRAIHDPSKRIQMCMGRRSGKSTACVVMALRVCLSREDANVIFIYPSRERAKSIIWPHFKKICQAYSIPADFNETALSVTFRDTKSVVRLIGVEDQFHSDRLRGHPCALYVIDEAQSFRDKVLRYLIDECIHMAAADLDATVVLAGTPCNTTKGLWYEADVRNNPKTKWSCYVGYTVLDNMFFQQWRGKDNWQDHARAWLAKEREDNGYSESNSRYRREYLGLWATDSTSFYYHAFDPVKNVISRDEIPIHQLSVRKCGGDFGSRVDPTAFVIVAYDEHVSKTLYVVDAVKVESPTEASSICFQLKRLIDKWGVTETVGDYAGGGAYLFSQMHERFGVWIEDAKKAKKKGTTEIINSEFYEGRIKIASDLEDLIGELKSIHWDDDHKGPLDSDPNDLADALQYIFTEAYAHLFKPAPPKKSERERMEEEMEAIFAEEDLRMEQAENDPFDIF